MNIRSNHLEVTVDADFPSIKQYKIHTSGATLLGSITNNKTIVINNEAFVPQTSHTIDNNKIEYTLTIKEIDVVLTTQIEVIDDIIDFKITNIQENGTFRVGTISFPNHELITISTDDKNPSFAGSKMFTAVEARVLYKICFFLRISLIVLTFVIFSFEFVATRFFVLFGPF